STWMRHEANERSTAAVRAKVRSRRSGKKKIDAKFFQVSLEAKHWALRSRFLCATKTRDRRITWRSQRNFGPHTPTSLMKPSMEYETGRAVAALRRGKQSAEWQQAQLQRKYCQCCMRNSRLSPTSRKFMKSLRKSIVPRSKQKTSRRTSFAARTPWRPKKWCR